MVKHHPRLFSALLVIGDLALTIAAAALAFYVRFYSGLLPVDILPNHEEYLILLIVACPICLIMFAFFRVYQPRRTESIFVDIPPVLAATVGIVLSLSAFTFFYREITFSRMTFGLFGSIFFIIISLERVAIRLLLKYLRSKGFNVKRLLVIGAGELGLRVAAAAKSNPSYGYKVIGMLDDFASNAVFKRDYGIPILGRTKELASVITQSNIDKVIIALPIRAYDKICRLVDRCEREGLETEIAPDFIKIIQSRSVVKDIDGLPVISIRAMPTESLGYLFVKRLFDIVFSGLVLLIGFPILAGLALGVKLSSPGPVFFSQVRVGINRNSFKMFKFRTMKVAPSAESDVTWTTQNDDRRTSFGTFLRHTSLDELPQFWNVLKGDMSIVGPRPERPFFAEQFKDEVPKYMVRHQVKTGITGWAQVNGWRGDTSIRKRLECDLYYLENWSLGFDLKIIALTVFKGLVHRNAY